MSEGKSTYCIQFDDLMWEMYLEIDHNHQNIDEIIYQMVEFWHGSQEKLALNNGDYLLCFLQQLGNEVLRIIWSSNLNLQGVIAHFDSLEGWVSMDGSSGIQIIGVDEIDFDDQEFTVLKEGEYI